MRTTWAGDREFRTSCHYRIVLFDRLAAEEQRLLRGLRRDSDFYGILKPKRASGGTIKAIDRETALLLYTLRQAGPVPAYVLESERASHHLSQLTELVLDGILEVRDGDRFLSGPAACSLLCVAPEVDSQDGVPARLSRAALRYGEALAIDDPEQLAFRLYAFHRLPLTPRWRRELGDTEAIRARIEGGPRRRQLAAWGQAVSRTDDSPWLGWTRRGGGPKGQSETQFKLYVSPATEGLETVFEALVGTLPTSRASSFKLGSDAAGLLRPDKLVVYFTDQDSLLQTAEELARRLAGTPAHGVPFSAEITRDGLLSWGIDPPGGNQLVPWMARESWRYWVVRRLASALVAAQRQPSTMAPWRFARERVRLAGVDIERWIPEPALWRSEAR